MSLFKTETKSHLTNSVLLSYGSDDWFPIRADGEWINRDEFINNQMERFNLKTPALVKRALGTVGL